MFTGEDLSPGQRMFDLSLGAAGSALDLGGAGLQLGNLSKGFPTVTNALEGISAPQVMRTGGRLGLSTESGAIKLGGTPEEVPIVGGKSNPSEVERNQPQQTKENLGSTPERQKVNTLQEIKINDSTTWKSGQPLANANKANINPAKFARYSMDPTNANNSGKWKAFRELGYEIQTVEQREVAAQTVISQLQKSLPTMNANFDKSTPYGARFKVNIQVIGPNGKSGTLVTEWQYDKDSNSPRLITNWLEVHKQK
jgi:hypothetical protein